MTPATDGPPLDAEAILTATEDVLRRFGPAKATVTDVARALGVSHASVYRHFPSKAALREEVTRRWLSRDQAKLGTLSRDPGTEPPERLRAWLTGVFALKRARVREDPELFETFKVLAAEHSQVAVSHVEEMLGQLGAIIADGVSGGDFAAPVPAAAARAVFDASTRFHHPAHSGEWESEGAEAALTAVCDLILDGLRPRA